jgi:hypothetical protein
MSFVLARELAVVELVEETVYHVRLNRKSAFQVASASSTASDPQVGTRRETKLLPIQV